MDALLRQPEAAAAAEEALKERIVGEWRNLRAHARADVDVDHRGRRFLDDRRIGVQQRFARGWTSRSCAGAATTSVLKASAAMAMRMKEEVSGMLMVQIAVPGLKAQALTVTHRWRLRRHSIARGIVALP